MCLSELVEQFLAYVRYERRLARTSCRDFYFQLHRYLRWLEENGYPSPTLDAFCSPVLRRFYHGLSQAGRRPRTLRACLYPLRSFGEWLVAGGHLPANPAKEITPPKRDAAQRPLIEDSEIQRLLEACERQADQRQVALSRALLSTLVYAGLRRSECLSLRVQDVSLEKRALLVASGKGSKSRTVYPCQECIAALADWLALRGDCEHEFLFAYNRRQRMSHQALKSMLERVAAIAGLAGNPAVKPHSLRHAAATRLARNGASLIAIQAFLGHSSIATTSAYLHANEQMARDVSELGAIKPSPREEEPLRDLGRRGRTGRQSQNGRMLRRRTEA